MAAPTWGIVTTVDEPTQLVIAFTAYHLALGARQIHVYFDRPDPEARAAIAALPGVFVTDCDDAYWAATERGKRPARHTGRQVINANDAYRATTVDWLLHCDADEFLRDGKAIADGLAAASPDTLSLKIDVLERVHLAGASETSIFDGIFRRRGQHFEDWGPTVYGRFAKFLFAGLSGHDAGKTLVRTGRDLRLGIHLPRNPDRTEIRHGGKIGPQLLHFDGLTRLHMMLKLLRRLELAKPDGQLVTRSAHRQRQLRFSRNHVTRGQEFDRLVCGLQEIDSGQVAALDALEILTHERFDPAPAIARMGVAPNLSPAAFDAAIRSRDAGLIEKYQLTV